MPRGWWWSRVAIGLPVGLLVGLVVGRLDDMQALIGFQVVVASVALLLMARLRGQLGGVHPRPTQARRAQHRDATLRGLDDWENLVVAAGAQAGHAHHRMRPRLRRLAADALARHHIDLDTEPERARAALGDEAYEWLRSDRPAPPNRHAGGPGLDCWDRIVGTIEQLEADEA